MTSNKDLILLESHLAGTLKRVSPPSDLIRRLRERIRVPDRAEIMLRLKDWRRLLLVFGGVMSVLMLIITVARALYHLVGRRTIG
ncbi:MAG: hypothetical protein FJZ87_13100 [Chloroflexi bacterium]|nr:hypothetical protein [Chloroflexota bacterium]